MTPLFRLLTSVVAGSSHVARAGSGGHRAFGRGTTEFPACDNGHVLVFLRHVDGENLLIVANLLPDPQSVGIQLPALAAGRRVVDLLGDARHPPVGPGVYALTLAPHACLWLALDVP